MAPLTGGTPFGMGAAFARQHSVKALPGQGHHAAATARHRTRSRPASAPPRLHIVRCDCLDDSGSCASSSQESSRERRGRPAVLRFAGPATPSGSRPALVVSRPGEGGCRCPIRAAPLTALSYDGVAVTRDVCRALPGAGRRGSPPPYRARPRRATRASSDARAGAYRRRIENRIRARNTTLPSMAA
jgi:hypothetical protein